GLWWRFWLRWWGRLLLANVNTSNRIIKSAMFRTYRQTVRPLSCLTDFKGVGYDVRSLQTTSSFHVCQREFLLLTTICTSFPITFELSDCFRLPKLFGVCGIGNDRACLVAGESTPPKWAFISNYFIKSASADFLLPIFDLSRKM
ncbi:hypothetical protein, partial [Kingella kingae]|uniref:hypothetical protein n=1 Tax=Kingella kingae TaxID=504 RepID=UPI002553A7A5